MSQAAPSRKPLGRFVVLSVIAAVFGPYVSGPYVSGGVRTEQVTIYGLLIMVGITWRRVKATPLAQFTFATWVVYALIAVVGAVAPVELPSVFLRGSVLAGLDNVTGPLWVMLLVWATVRPTEAAQLLSAAARLIAVAMAVNAVIALAMIFVDLAPYLRPFWGTAGDYVAAGMTASTVGRMLGIFNQPVEAGLAYSIAGLAACYVWRERPNWLLFWLIPIVLGGLVSISKVFILGGLPLILWYAWRSKVGRGRITLLMVVAVPFLGIVASGTISRTALLGNIGGFLHPTVDSALSTYTAGRFGNGNASSLTSLWDEVILLDPWFGLGAGGLQVPYDNGWAEAFVMAGLVGVICYTLTLFLLWRMARTIHHPARRRLMLGLVALAAGASLGIPALTTNRASTLLWVLIALLSSAQAHSGRPVRSDPSTSMSAESLHGCAPPAIVVSPSREGSSTSETSQDASPREDVSACPTFLH